MNPSGRRDRAFYARAAEAVARDLLGDLLWNRRADGTVQAARIVETEAYVGAHDLACHASKGRTPRTEVLYGPPGHAYVYFVYGMHHLLNAVAAPEGDPQAVLVRAAEPVAGFQEGAPPRMDGPARLTKALGVTVGGHNQLDLIRDRLWIAPGPDPPDVATGPRIGVDYAGVWADAPLRFWDAGSRNVSRPAHRQMDASGQPMRRTLGPNARMGHP